MPIHTPGVRDRYGRKKSSGKRSVVAVLSLTAMVDLFTVLVVFLLQNYNSTGEVINVHDAVKLPSAAEVKELKPSNVVVVSQEGVFLNKTQVANFFEVKEKQEWMIEKLKVSLEALIAAGETEKVSMKNRFQKAVQEAKGVVVEPKMDQFRRISIQADKSIDFLTIKKVMFTITEAGIYEINFAVIKKVRENSEKI